MYNHNDTNDNRTCCTYATSTQTNVLCNGGTTGTMTASASGGTTAYTYVIAGPVVNTTGATSGVITGLKAGSYTCHVSTATRKRATARTRIPTTDGKKILWCFFCFFYCFLLVGKKKKKKQKNKTKKKNNGSDIRGVHRTECRKLH